ncbi:MAG: hypothetical protein JWM73_2423, partial [Solirubrobacterales bacterium]|nr:hypothetical protein [Solirubrobacterales bacterium]
GEVEAGIAPSPAPGATFAGATRN